MFQMVTKFSASFSLFLFLTAIPCSFSQNDLSAPSPPRIGDRILGKEKSQLCQGCHGEDGNSLSTLVPKLAGQNSAYIYKQVRNFQSGSRKHRIMDDLSITVNDDDLIDISAYFESLTIMKGDSPSDNEIGKSIFLNGDKRREIRPCIDCHGINGKGLNPNPDMAPIIGGQNKDYLQKQLYNFKKEDRKNSPGGAMNGMTKPLTDDEIESLSDYISGL